MIAVESLAMPSFDLYRSQADLALRVGRMLPEGAELAAVGLPDPQVLYYLPLPVRRLDDVPALADRLEGDPSPVVYVVGPIRQLDALRGLGAVRVLDRAAEVHPRKGMADRLIAAEVRPRTRPPRRPRPPPAPLIPPLRPPPRGAPEQGVEFVDQSRRRFRSGDAMRGHFESGFLLAAPPIDGAIIDGVSRPQQGRDVASGRDSSATDDR